MKIRAITALPVNIPFRAPYRFSYGAIASLTKTVIRLETEDGVTGLGECADGDRAADVIAAGQRLIGHDLRDITTAEALLVPAMRYTPWGNVSAARRVFGGIEMAMWDARGKTEGIPLYQLLGVRPAMISRSPNTSPTAFPAPLTPARPRPPTSPAPAPR